MQNGTQIPLINQIGRRLLNAELWVVGGLIAASLVWERLLPITILAGLGFWLIRWAACGCLTRRTPADWGIAILAIMAVCGFFLSGRSEVAFIQVCRLLAGIVLYYAVANRITSLRGNIYLVGGYLLAGLGLAAFALVGVQWADDKVAFIPPSVYRYFDLLVSDAANPNVLAGYLAILLPFPLALILYGVESQEGKRGSVFLRWLAIVACVIMIAILVLTQSRGAWIASVCALLLLVSLRWKWGWVSIPLVLAGAAGMVLYVGLPILVETLMTSRNAVSLSDRTDLWYRAIMVIRDFPFSGVGMGSFGRVVELFYPYRYAGLNTEIHAHSLPLQIAVDLGLPGLIAWLAVVFGLGSASSQIYLRGRRIADRLLAGLGAAYLGSLAAYFVHGMIDAVTWGMVRPAPLYWAVWGGVAALAAYSMLAVNKPETD